MKNILQFFNTRQRIAIIIGALAIPQAIITSGNGAALLLLVAAGFISWEQAHKEEG